MSDAIHTILYIEDDPASRRLVERALLAEGFNVLVAATGLEGVDLARAYVPDLVLTDINLPDLNGQEIATTLRLDPRFAHTPIVALTAQAQGGKEWQMAFAAGINGYITKPIAVEHLGERARYYLAGGRDSFDPTLMESARATYTHETVARLERQIRELQHANESLRELDKVKDSFIELTAHELRTPLTLLYGYSRLLDDNTALSRLRGQDMEVHALFDGMAEAITRMQRIIGEIVTIGRIMTNRLELNMSPINMQYIAEKTVHAYQAALNDRRITVHFNAAAWQGVLQGDGELIYLLLSNLFSNALKYTPDGGSITLGAGVRDGRFTFSVADSGIGIDREQQARIFDRFFTTNDLSLHSTSKTAYKGGGLGLGLAICKGIVDAHSGHIWVESTGRDEQKLPGSTFHVSLPQQPPRGTRPTPAGSSI